MFSVNQIELSEYPKLSLPIILTVIHLYMYISTVLEKGFKLHFDLKKYQVHSLMNSLYLIDTKKNATFRIVTSME